MIALACGGSCAMWKAAELDVIVTYKLDRLSRSLTDFVKLIKSFDKHEVTFVSITQHFLQHLPRAVAERIGPEATRITKHHDVVAG